MPDKKYAMTGIWNISPKQKHPHNINETIELMDKYIFSSWAKDIKKSKLNGIKTEYVKKVPAKKNIMENNKIRKKRTSLIFSTAGLINFKKLYIIIGRDIKTPEKTAIDRYKTNGAWGDR